MAVMIRSLDPAAHAGHRVELLPAAGPTPALLHCRQCEVTVAVFPDDGAPAADPAGLAGRLVDAVVWLEAAVRAERAAVPPAGGWPADPFRDDPYWRGRRDGARDARELLYAHLRGIALDELGRLVPAADGFAGRATAAAAVADRRRAAVFSAARPAAT